MACGRRGLLVQNDGQDLIARSLRLWTVVGSSTACLSRITRAALLLPQVRSRMALSTALGKAFIRMNNLPY